MEVTPLIFCMTIIAITLAFMLFARQKQPTLTTLQSSPQTSVSKPFHAGSDISHNTTSDKTLIAYQDPVDPMVSPCSGDGCDLYTLLDRTQQAAIDVVSG